MTRYPTIDPSKQLDSSIACTSRLEIPIERLYCEHAASALTNSSIVAQLRTIGWKVTIETHNSNSVTLDAHIPVLESDRVTPMAWNPCQSNAPLWPSYTPRKKLPSLTIQIEKKRAILTHALRLSSGYQTSPSVEGINTMYALLLELREKGTMIFKPL